MFYNYCNFDTQAKPQKLPFPIVVTLKKGQMFSRYMISIEAPRATS